MTAEQREAFSRVRATAAYANDAGSPMSNHRTEDMLLVLEILEEQRSAMKSVDMDLEDLRYFFTSGTTDHGMIALIDSMRTFIKGGDYA